MKASELYELRMPHREEDGDFVVAHRGNIWVVSDETDDDVREQIAQALGLDVEITDWYDFMQNMRETRPDVLVGQYDESSRSLYMDTDDAPLQDPHTSQLVKKVVQQLGISHIDSSAMHGGVEDEQYSISREEMLGKIPNTMYHGTTIDRMESILKTGLQAKDVKKNWDVKFPYVFVTAKPRYARFHAERNAMNKTIAVVLEIKIPDMDQIIMDYDVAMAVYGKDHPEVKKLGYSDTEWADRFKTNQMMQKVNKKTKLDTQMGVFAYRKRIPASHIVKIYSSMQQITTPDRNGQGEYSGQVEYNDWHEFTPEEFVEIMKIQSELNEFGAHWTPEWGYTWEEFQEVYKEEFPDDEDDY